MTVSLRLGSVVLLAAALVIRSAPLIGQAPEATVSLRASCGKWTVDSPLPAHTGDPTWPTFRLRFENAGTAPSALVIGSVIGNDQYFWLQHLTLEVRSAGQPDRQLQYFPAGMPSGIAGRVDPWVVPLPSGVSYEVALAPRFAETIGAPFETFDKPGEMRFAFTPGTPVPLSGPELGPFTHFWSQPLTSAWMPFPSACPR